MRLWHEDLISKLPRQQLLGQWRECIALLGNDWGKKHSIVNYVFNYDESKLVGFSFKVANEMIHRGYKPNEYLIIKALEKRHGIYTSYIIYQKGKFISANYSIYPEHNEQYYQECIENLKSKGVKIDG